MRALALVGAAGVVAFAGGSAAAHPAKSWSSFASLAEGVSHVPLQQTRIEIARTPKEARQWNDETRCYCDWGDFEDSVLVGVFYAGRSDVRVTGFINFGDKLSLVLTVPPAGATPTNGAYNVIALPRIPLESVRKVEVFRVDEQPLQPVPWVVDPNHDPDVTVRAKARPRAGRVFTAVVTEIAHRGSYLVMRTDCRASLCGRVQRSGDFKRLRGARLLRHPIVRKTYTNEGHVKTIRCAWKLPNGSAGKLLTLGENECYDDCASGFTLALALAAGDVGHGGFTSSWSGWNWRIR